MALNVAGKDIPDIYPVRTMDPYKPCWCGSGAKWKWCHKDRHLQQEIAPGLFIHKMYQEAKKGICFHPNAPEGCSEKIIRAHTVQKRGGLQAIADNGHVLSLRDRIIGKKAIDEIPEPATVGVNDASTFMGFCNHHDTTLFKPVEGKCAQLDSYGLFLLAFRAACYEMLNKTLAVRWAEHQRDLDKGRPFEAQAEIQSTIHYVLQGSLLAVEDSKHWKAEYDLAFKTNDLSNFWYHAIVFEGVLPFVAAGGVMPEVTFEGKFCQSLAERTDELEALTVNVTSFEGDTVVIFSWLGKAGGAAEAFVKSFAVIDPASAADRVLCFLFEHIENTFLNPGWWQTLSEVKRARLLARMENGTISGMRPQGCLLPDGESYIGHKVVKEIISRLPTSN